MLKYVSSFTVIVCLMTGCTKLPDDIGVLPDISLSLTRPDPPVITNITAWDTSVTITWNPVTGADDYMIYYAEGTTVDTISGLTWYPAASPQIITGLTNGTQYAFSVISKKSGVHSLISNVMTATPFLIVYGTVNDIDGNVYRTVNIGTQVWMAENLKTTHFNDGTAIPLVTNNLAWNMLDTSPGFCWYNNDSSSYGTTYGALYNWSAVNTGKLAPSGWHVPSDSEWSVLTTYLGNDSLVGGKLKESGTAHWLSYNTGATNETGFTALPGGYRSNDGSYASIGFIGYWWTATRSENPPLLFACNRLMKRSDGVVGRESHTMGIIGASVRCVKD
jgi:uncharacterized protein (TIGR02145 family)